MVEGPNQKYQGAAEVIWLVQPGDDTTEGRPHCSLQLPHERGGDNVRNSISARTADTRKSRGGGPGSAGGRRGRGGRCPPPACLPRPAAAPLSALGPCRTGGAQASAPGRPPPPPPRRRGGCAQPAGPCLPPPAFLESFLPGRQAVKRPCLEMRPRCRLPPPLHEAAVRRCRRCPRTAPYLGRRQAGGRPGEQPGHASGLGWARLPASLSHRHHVTPTKHVCAPVCGGGDFLIRRRLHRRRDKKGHPPSYAPRAAASRLCPAAARARAPCPPAPPDSWLRQRSAAHPRLRLGTELFQVPNTAVPSPDIGAGEPQLPEHPRALHPRSRPAGLKKNKFPRTPEIKRFFAWQAIPKL
ncbi:basic salivary proline-rich protein 4-like [Oenanthe melanoleuca]|uniref:basic salivary proline-rich protein 4-like n=1 Tax=Oenanthe melanoleuca TaxID=2939378 RepID=UPI0024C1158B|nr:basic salivary proline-rich protein 4-like [Oenanthe melanoleuca]